MEPGDSGKVYVVGTPSNLGLISLDITGFLMLPILSMYRYLGDIWFSDKILWFQHMVSNNTLGIA